MSNVLSEEKKQQVIALGRLGWPLRRIEQETGVRRETAGAYLKAAGIGVRPPGAWGRRALAKPANEVTTGSDATKPANTVNANTNTENPSSKEKAKAEAKPANAHEVITGFGVELSDSGPKDPKHALSTSFCEPFRDAIELGLGAIIHEPVQDVGAGIRVTELRDPFGNLLGLIENPHFDAKLVR